jgi:hypothetical protein
MKTELLSIAARLSNKELLAQVKNLARDEREATASLVAHLAELDERRLYLGEGCSSLFAYCVEILHLAEHAAYGRIQAARAARKFPVVLERLTGGALNLTTLGLLAPHLTAENHLELLAAADHKSKRCVEEIVASVRPLPAVPASIRKQSFVIAAGDPLAATQRTGSSATVLATPGTKPPVQRPESPALTVPATSRAVIAPLAPERYKVQFTASAETHEKLRRAQDLLRHQIPNGDPGAVIDRALTVLLAHLEKTKLAAAVRPRPEGATRRGSRHIPAAVRRAAWKRDGGRCGFVSPDGRRCNEQGFLEFHHVKPHGDGGEPSVENIQLRCRAHNQYEADLYFGAGNKAARRADERTREQRTPEQKPAALSVGARMATGSRSSIVRESPAVYHSSSSATGLGSWRRALGLDPGGGSGRGGSSRPAIALELELRNRDRTS